MDNTTASETKRALAFERTNMKKIRRRLSRLRGEVDVEECASVALCLMWAKWLTVEEAVQIAVHGGDVATGVPLAADLSKRRLGYRPLKMHNAVSYAEHYGLAPCEPAAEPSLYDQLCESRSRLAKLVPEGSADFDLAWRWIEARKNGATHIEAAVQCGFAGSAKACESFSMRMAAKLQRRARKILEKRCEGFRPFRRLYMEG